MSDAGDGLDQATPLTRLGVAEDEKRLIHMTRVLDPKPGIWAGRTPNGVFFFFFFFFFF